MAGLTLDAVAPSATGAVSGSSDQLIWTHMVGSGSNRLLLVGFTMNPDGSDDGYSIVSVTCNSTAMTQLGMRHSDDQDAGFMAAYKLINPPSGAVTITVTLNGVADCIVGGSISFTGADQTTGTGTPVVQVGDSSTTSTEAQIVVPSSTSGNTIMGFLGAGSGSLNTASPGTSQIENNDNGDAAAGCFSLQTTPATGSSLTVEWEGFSDWWAGIAVEVLGATAGSPAPNLTMLGLV